MADSKATLDDWDLARFLRIAIQGHGAFRCFMEHFANEWSQDATADC
ncbi:hypothetical protein [Streptomyces sp. ActVer]|nr:hypothetical protein [Streptomyces sp. ActVer]MCZ4507876.1 hypothetical protein [Streptomyces sp. ActVer]